MEEIQYIVRNAQANRSHVKVKAGAGTEPALPQTLFRMSDPTMLAKFTDATGRSAKLAKTKLSDDEKVHICSQSAHSS